jgi:hypothetical protein
MKIKTPVFGSAFFPPIQYFAHLILQNETLVEANCNYSRQTYRNRYLISGANGVLQMTVPVEKVSGQKTKTKDIQVSCDTPWQELHWRSIVSAYNASPYFQYYDLDIEPFFNKKWKYLLDMNLASVQTIIECLGLKTSIVLTDDYLPQDQYIEDYREIIHPKKDYGTDTRFQSVSYRQVFEQKHGFLPNLSILDLLFNKGPESLLVLKESLIIQIK